LPQWLLRRRVRAEQRQDHGDNYALPGYGTPHELTAIQLANQTHIAPCGKEIHGYAERNERRAKPAGLTAKIAASADGCGKTEQVICGPQT
jgi:hypothetical protein